MSGQFLLQSVPSSQQPCANLGIRCMYVLAACIRTFLRGSTVFRNRVGGHIPSRGEGGTAPPSCGAATADEDSCMTITIPCSVCPITVSSSGIGPIYQQFSGGQKTTCNQCRTRHLETHCMKAISVFCSGGGLKNHDHEHDQLPVTGKTCPSL